MSLQPNLTLITQEPELIWTDLSETLCTSRNFKDLCADCWLLFWQVCCTLCYPQLSATSEILRNRMTLDSSPIFIAVTNKIQKYFQLKCLRIQKKIWNWTQCLGQTRKTLAYHGYLINVGHKRVHYGCSTVPPNVLKMIMNGRKI